MIIYLARNKVNDKIYIGKTVRPLSERWWCHTSKAKKGSNYFFHRAIRKYGANAFEVSEVCRGESLKDLSMLERLLIAQHRSNDQQFGYNMTEGGEGTSGIVRSPETIQKLRESHLGYKRSEESKRTQSEAQRGTKRSAEARKNMSLAQIATYQRGRKASYGNKGQHHSAEAKEKMRLAKIGFVFSEEHRRKLSEITKKYWATRKSKGE